MPWTDFFVFFWPKLIPFHQSPNLCTIFSFLVRIFFDRIYRVYCVFFSLHYPVKVEKGPNFFACQKFFFNVVWAITTFFAYNVVHIFFVSFMFYFIVMLARLLQYLFSRTHGVNINFWGVEFDNQKHVSRSCSVFS